MNEWKILVADGLAESGQAILSQSARLDDRTGISPDELAQEIPEYDALIVRSVPDVRKAVRWNSPFYGIENQGWFLSFHCYTNYVKVAFFRGSSLRPVPPGKSKHDEVRYLDIHEDDPLDEKQLADWIRQAAAVPGWVP